MQKQAFEKLFDPGSRIAFTNDVYQVTFLSMPPTNGTNISFSYLVLNPFKEGSEQRKKENVLCRIGFTVEQDSCSKEIQRAWFEDVLGKTSVRVDSAGKSIHHHERYAQPVTPEQEHELVRLYKLVFPFLDQQVISDSARWCRTPGGLRNGKVQTIEYIGERLNYDNRLKQLQMAVERISNPIAKILKPPSFANLAAKKINEARLEGKKIEVLKLFKNKEPIPIHDVLQQALEDLIKSGYLMEPASWPIRALQDTFSFFTGEQEFLACLDAVIQNNIPAPPSIISQHPAPIEIIAPEISTSNTPPVTIASSTLIDTRSFLRRFGLVFEEEPHGHGVKMVFRCPAETQHSTRDGVKDCAVFDVPGEPLTVHCFHDSHANFQLKDLCATIGAPQVSKCKHCGYLIHWEGKVPQNLDGSDHRNNCPNKPASKCNRCGEEIIWDEKRHPKDPDGSDHRYSCAARREQKNQEQEENRSATLEQYTDRPIIMTNNRHLHRISDDSLRVLEQNNIPPFLFVRFGTICRVIRDEEAQLIIDELDEASLRSILDRQAYFLKEAKEGIIPSRPPRDVLEDILALSHWPFPVLKGIHETPILRPDGSILTERGYDPQTKLFFSPPDNFTMPTISSSPSNEEMDRAKKIIDETIGEFPYVDEDSKANAFGLLLTPFILPAIKGKAPLALIDAPQMGTGKSLLAEAISVIPGTYADFVTDIDEDEEWRKKLTALFDKGTSLICIDNLERKLKSANLAAALTLETWSDRPLGATRIFKIFPTAHLDRNRKQYSIGRRSSATLLLDTHGRPMRPTLDGPKFLSSSFDSMDQGKPRNHSMGLLDPWPQLVCPGLPQGRNRHRLLRGLERDDWRDSRMRWDSWIPQ